jgi:hypothetical protein
VSSAAAGRTSPIHTTCHDRSVEPSNRNLEYRAGTNPNDANSVLRVTAINAPSPGTAVNLTWTSVNNRFYYILENLNLAGPPTWFDSGLGTIAPDGTTTTRLVSNTNAPVRFYRVEAFGPLGP